MTEKIWFVYIIQCKDKSLYTGITTDLKRRFLEHLNKQGAKYCNAHPVEKLVFSQTFRDRSTASKKEWAIKRLTRQQKMILLRSSENEMMRNESTLKSPGP